MENPEASSFGEILRSFRIRSVDKRAGARLSQVQFAKRLSQKTGFIVTRNRVGNWETNKTHIPVYDRKILIAILAVLCEHQGITTLEETDRLLKAGNYRNLEDKEKAEINPNWGMAGSAAPVDVNIKSRSLVPDGKFDLPGDAVSQKTGRGIELYSTECGNMPINLAQQRLLVSTSFGSYFAGLLERPNIYLDLELQIDCPVPKGQEELRPLQRIFWLLEYPRGPRTMIVGGEGGMGKSTLSAKIIRCLYQEQAFDMILGDSAKSEHADPVTGEIVQYMPGYYDAETFYRRMCSQLGLPGLPGKQAIEAIKDRLVGRRAVIVVDNLETVKEGDGILDSLKAITSRDVRAIVTTREVIGVKTLGRDLFVVQLQPLTDPGTAAHFLLWHIEEYQYQQPALRKLKDDLNHYIKWLIERTGGIPLLMQLVLSDAARYSWDYVQSLPSLFGIELLDYLYRTRWDDLGSRGRDGEAARHLLEWIARNQYRRQEITSKEIFEWAGSNNQEAHLSAALSLLFEMFLVINRDIQKGNFSIYPSLAEFVNSRAL
jgi:hypothetical protein